MAVILAYTGSSDGDSSKRPNSDSDMVRNDNYYKERVASDKWAKELPNFKPNTKYMLDKLPDGYACFERTRTGTSHVDRYLYGHPKGVFRSLNEFYPHFKHLLENDGPEGCTCKLCAGAPKKPRPSLGGSSVSKPQPQPKKVNSRPAPSADSRTDLLEGRPADEHPSKRRRTKTDSEGTLDAIAQLVRKLQAEGLEGESVEEAIAEYYSPDWRVGHNMLIELLNDWKKLPLHVPRVGELVLFVRPDLDGTVASPISAGRWEAGVVTQMPEEAITDDDLEEVPASKEASHVNTTGFRIEPFVPPHKKNINNRHSYVPLHLIRPLHLFATYFKGIPQKDWHPTILHALQPMSSFCLVARHHFKGKWPNATVFCEGLYIGSEMVMTGDFIRIAGREHEGGDLNVCTDIMRITSITLCILNLDDPELADLYSRGHPFQTCLHIRGRQYTLDPARSANGAGKDPVSPQSGEIPPGIMAMGKWYHFLDPAKPKMRLEIPFQRILGRCPEVAALEAWSPSTKATKADPFAVLSLGVPAIQQARNYSVAKDPRIALLPKVHPPKTWFWADSRIHQLELLEVNNVSVGKHPEAARGPLEMMNWKKALDALNGKKEAIENLQNRNVKKVSASQSAKASAADASVKSLANSMMGRSSLGMTSFHALTATDLLPKTSDEDEDEDEDESVHDDMDVDEDVSSNQPGKPALQKVQKRIEKIDIEEDDDDDDESE